MRWDVVVVGAGAAGLLTATRAAERGRRTLLLEKNRKPGVKILMSGGTRCNLTHDTDALGIVEAFGQKGKFLYSALASLGPRELVELIETEGVPTKIEPTGKVFPVSNKATDVLAGLLRRLERSGASLALNEPLLRVEVAPEGFRLTTSHRSLLAGKAIITTGGQSYPGCGTTGDGYAWASALGHTIVPARPALVPVCVGAEWVKTLAGVTLPDVAVRVLDSGTNDVLAQRRGSFLFTHFGLSGPAVLDVSAAITGHVDPRARCLECDFTPAETEQQLGEWLRQESAAAGKRLLANVLAARLPNRLAECLLDQARVPTDRRAAGLTRDERTRLVQAVKKQTLHVTETLGFKKAEVTAGGISLEQVDSRSMQSKLVPDLYLAGEILDLDGPIGGYNFQAAFSTGWLAGGSV